VKLEEDGDGTLLKYEVHAAVGGKLAQLGSRLIDGTARKMAAEFFSNFAELAAGEAADEAVPLPAAEAAPEAAARGGLSARSWVLILIVAVLVVLGLFTL